VFDRLIMTGPDPKPPDKIALIPYLASSWTATSTKITFTLRKDASCTDGSPVTATVVEKNYERITSGGRNTVAPFGAGPISFEADGAASTFAVTLGTPFSDAIYAFANQAIVCPASLPDANTLMTTGVGSGPYTIESAVHGDQVVYKRRDDWKWGPNGITTKDLPEKIIYKIVDNDTTAANLLLTGGLDIARSSGSDTPVLIPTV
jgi:peptide/nickel transport system substrate-binding protein